MHRSTVLAARILGPALLVFGTAVIAGGVRLTEIAAALAVNAALRVFAAAISLILGTTLAVLHHRWDCRPAIAVSLIAWLLALRGAVLLVAPPVLSNLGSVTEASFLPALSGSLMLAIGGWLAVVGFSRGSRRPE